MYRDKLLMKECFYYFKSKFDSHHQSKSINEIEDSSNKQKIQNNGIVVDLKKEIKKLKLLLLQKDREIESLIQT